MGMYVVYSEDTGLIVSKPVDYKTAQAIAEAGIGGGDYEVWPYDIEIRLIKTQRTITQKGEEFVRPLYRVWVLGNLPEAEGVILEGGEFSKQSSAMRYLTALNRQLQGSANITIRSVG